MSKDDIQQGPSDHLKYYCIVFGILVIVIGVVALNQRSTLEDYRAANRSAENLLMAQGKTREGRPRAIGDLAVEVERFVKGYSQSSGGTNEGGISTTRMQEVEVKVHLEHGNAGPVNEEENRGKGYKTTSREFTYGDATLEQLVSLIYNIETWGRYRVFELRWKLAEKKQNSEPPFNKVHRPTIKVGYRTPITRSR